ncbi:hypothetical protein BDZ89DRAFT_1068819 [Hymenopellis radicata]|nr:hypothetical protein BDZ89DRAFT_1068819 [Hymenopellis radicata]
MSDIPKLVYKIVAAAPPSPLPHVLPLSSLDAQDGFIHLSIAVQIPTTADLFFDRDTTLWLLKLDKQVAEKEGGRFVWADNAPGCVHLYGKETGQWDGARLGEGTIIDSKECRRAEKETWADAMKSCFEEGWLVDAEM